MSKGAGVSEAKEAEKKKGRHPRDQKELDRAQEYIKKNPKFGVKEGKGYQPEIEHSKLGDAKKKADKKRESKLPPHLQGDAIGKMRKAFSQEGYRVLAKGDDGKRAQFSYKDEKDAKKFASTFKKATVTKEDKAFEFVKNKLKKKYGDGVLTTGEKPKPPTAKQKAEYAAHKAKIAKQDHRDPTEKASDGRYSDRHSNRGSD